MSFEHHSLSAVRKVDWPDGIACELVQAHLVEAVRSQAESEYRETAARSSAPLWLITGSCLIPNSRHGLRQRPKSWSASCNRI